jgi:hypothetical protein
MSIYICTICNNQKDSDFNCAELHGKECCEECFGEHEPNEETQQAFNEDLTKATRFSSVEELFNNLMRK